MIEENRKTNIPLKTIPRIVEWILHNCSADEIFFMAELGGDRRSYTLLKSIVDRLIDYNVYQVFYAKVKDANELALFRSQKDGEVSGLKAFVLACEAARTVVTQREEQSKSKRRKKSEDEE